MRQKLKFSCSCHNKFNLETMYKSVFAKQRSRPFNGKILSIVSLSVIFVSFCVSRAQGAYRYNLESCSDLVPRHVPDRQPENFNIHEYLQPTSSWHRNGNSGSSQTRNKREVYNDSPFRITVPVKRYRRNANLSVRIEGKGYFDAVMIQGRAVNNGNFISGGVGLLGNFDLNRNEHRNFSYLECFREPHATVVDNGYTKLGNTTFVWVPPDSDKGDIRFLAGVAKGGHYWIVASSIMHFNPFPISIVQCGGAEACFRVCPLDYPNWCDSEEAILMYNYNTDLVGKREVEFTLGGKLPSSQASYIGVVHAEDNDNLYQADVTVCYMEHGRAKVEHYIMDVIGAPLIPHTEEISIDDYDYDGNMLWCRYRRPIGHSQSSVVNTWRNLYTLLYRGEIDPNPHAYPKLQTPQRDNMFSSDRKLNFSTPINEIYSGCVPLRYFAIPCHIIVLLVTVVLKANMIPYL